MEVVNKLRRSFSISLSLLTVSILCNQALLPAWSQGLPSFSQPSSPADHLPAGSSSLASAEGSGALLAMLPGGNQLGQCPLKHTTVKAQISGYVARVSVKQTFHNTFKDKIEAIYSFPLPENAAVDEMTMKIGDRIIKGVIKKREEAREIYETARAAGHVASLLDQERPNIFTQSVANIEPGAQVEIEIKYVDMLPYEAGNFTFTFPTVVGPRFNPGSPIGKEGPGRAPDTDEVPDASKITPLTAAAGHRAGHDISIDVNIAAGVHLDHVQSKLHEVKVTHDGDDDAHITLADKATIPNKDFVLTWSVAKDSLQSGYLTHRDDKSGFFTLMLLPPKRITPEKVAPKEMVFLIDCSGSQSGRPLEKAKETMEYIVDHMNANDTFQVLAFNNGVTEFAPKPQKASAQLTQSAKAWIEKLTARGGTWMAPAVEKVMAIPPDENRLRIVVFMTDGFVGNDFAIRELVKKHRGTSRWFPFGTGNSVNRFLIDGIAQDGGGEAEYVLLNSPGPVVGEKFYKRISSPVLTDVKLDFHGLPVKEVYPVEISDVWAERPLYFKGRYLKPGAGTVSLTGFAAGKPYKQDLKIVFPEKQDGNSVIKSIWARAKVDRLMSEDWGGAQRGAVNQELKDEIVKTALDYHLMTQYTSFVAVEEKIVTKGGKATTVPVEVEVPDGVSREATVGKNDAGSLGGTHQHYRRIQAQGMPGGAQFGAAGSGGFVSLSPPNSTPYQTGQGARNGPSFGYPVPVSAAGAGSMAAGKSSYYGNFQPGAFNTTPVSGRLLSRAKEASGGVGMGGGGGLPPTNQGRFIRQPGDNQYSVTPQLERHGSAPQLLSRPSASTDLSIAPSTKLSEEFTPKAEPRKAVLKKKQNDKDTKQEAKGKRTEDSAKPDATASSKLDGLLRQLQGAGSAKAGEIAGLDIVDGKVAVKLTVTAVSDEVLQLLKNAGFQLVSKAETKLSGRISITDLLKLCDLKEVLRIQATHLDAS